MANKMRMEGNSYSITKQLAQAQPTQPLAEHVGNGALSTVMAFTSIEAWYGVPSHDGLHMRRTAIVFP